MKKRHWVLIDRFMRVGHLYTSLFLVPWMMVYAISAFFLNHDAWFADSQPKWETISDEAFTPDEGFPEASEAQARFLMKELDLEGPYKIFKDDEKLLSIYRFCVTGAYQIHWRRDTSKLELRQQQPASFHSFVKALHFQRGYNKPYPAYIPGVIWALMVDVVTISTVFWVISGIYLWARRRRNRMAGGICLASGCLLFAILVFFLSQ